MLATSSITKRTSPPVEISSKETVKLTYKFDEYNSDERLQELILYIAEKCEEDPTFGATKLNKILYLQISFHFLKGVNL
jgi:hypothetical protein